MVTRIGRGLKKRSLLSLAAWGFVGLVVAALVTGYLGLAGFVHANPSSEYDDQLLDLVYYDLQLFVLGSDPLQGNTASLPVLLHIARFLAPAATIYALIGTAWLVFAEQWKAFRRRHRKGHRVVVGDTQIAATILANLLAQRKPVVHDPLGTAESLTAAGIAGADYLYACVDESADGAANVAVALAARSVPRKERHLGVYAHVSDPMLRVALRARRLGLRGDKFLHLDFFNVEELAAQRLMADEKVADARHVLIAGLGVFGQAVLVELARQRQLQAPTGAPLLEVTLVDRDRRDGPTVAERVTGLVARSPVIAATCRLRTLAEVPTDRPEAGLPCPDRAYICYDDENLALKTALSATYLWHVDPKALVVRLNRMARHSEAFQTRAEADQKARWKLLDDLDGRLRLIGVTDLGCQP